MLDVVAKKLFTFLGIILFSLPIHAMNGRTTYQAKISKPDGYPLEAVSVNFRFTVIDTVGTCILYVEDYAAVNMQNTGGLVSFALGSGVRAYPASGTAQTFQNIFDNSVPSFPCQAGGNYFPAATDTRRVVMQFNEGVGWQSLPAMAINSVPYSMYAGTANTAKTLNNKADTDFVEYASLAGLNCQSNEAIQFNGVSFGCIPVSGISVSGSVLAIGGTASAPVISMSAASVSQDGYVTSTDFSEFKAKVSSVSATSPLSSTGGTTPTISITQASSTTNGYLSSADWSTFNNKQAALGFTPLDSAVSGTFAVKANNLSDLTNVSTARTNLGLGSFATANSLDLGSASATGTIAEARFANRTGVTSGTQYTKVTVDGKGFVTNGSNLSAGDVTTALGFTPASASASTQWSTSGTTINYTAGNVGVGTSAPLAPLHIRRPVGSSQALLLEGDSAVSGLPKITFLDLNGGSTEGHIGFDVTNGFSMMGGKVGIGTTTPAAALDVLSGSLRFSTMLSGQGISGYSGGGVNVMNLNREDALGTGGLSMSAYGGIGLAAGETAQNTNYDLYVNTNGRVGIGTNTPAASLEVKNASATVRVTASDGISATYFMSNINGLFRSFFGTEGLGGTTFTDSLTYATILGSESNVPVQIATQDAVRMTVLPNGNVGVGTITPATKLDVQGQIKTSMGTPLVNPAGEAVDFVTGNTQYVTFSTCPGNALTVNLYSMFEGGSYSIIVVAPSGCVVDFTGTTHTSGGSGGTPVTAFKYPAGQKFSSTGNPMVYSFLRANNFVFVAQVVDFQ